MRLESFRHHVLSLMFVSDQFIATAANLLQPRFFDTPAEQHMTRLILEYYREYNKTPKRMAIAEAAHAYFSKSKGLSDVADEFELLLDIVSDLHQEAAEQSDFILDRIVAFCQEESLKDALLKSVDDIQQGKFNEVLPRITKAMSIGAELDGLGTFVFKNADQRKTVAQARRIIPSGLEWLDAPTRGGVGKREMFIIMAPPNVGKTTALINVGSGVAKKGHKVAHFTLEMSEDLVRAKYDQCILGKSDDEFEAIDEEGRNKIAKFMKRMGKNLGSDIYIKEFPPHRLSAQGLRAHLMLLKAQTGFDPDLIIIDYMDIMELPTHIKDEYKQLAWLGVEIRALGGMLNSAMGTASQTNRGGASKETAMGEDVAGDFTKLATCDFLMSLNQTKKEAEEQEARMQWIKNRVGPKYNMYKLITDYERSLLQPA